MAKQKIKTFDTASGYDLAASFYDKKEKYLNSFEKGHILSLLGSVQGKRILDVGAGTGRLALDLIKAGAQVTALDLSKNMLNQLKQKTSKVKIVLGDAENLPFEEKSFDAVIAAFLIVHLKEPLIFFDQVYRVLKEGGIFVCTNINQKEPPPIETTRGIIKIESYYHRPEKILEDLQNLAFTIKEEKIIKEKDVWINQIIVAQK